MGNCKVNAKLMIDDDFGDDDDGDDDVSLACSKTRQRFWELRTA